MIDLTFIEYAIIFELIAFAGFVDAIAGGGGLITIPTYMAFGLPQSFILGTNKFVSTIGTSSAVLRFIKSGRVNWKIALPGSVAAFFASIFGALLSRYLSSEAMVYLLLVIIPVILWMQKRKSSLSAKQAEHDALSDNSKLLRAILCGGLLGAYDGFFGPGTGTFLLIALHLFLGLGLLDASVNGRIINFASNLSAFFIFFFKGQILWQLGLMAALAAMLGNWLGSGFALKGNEKHIRMAFYFVLFLLLLKCLHSLWITS